MKRKRGKINKARAVILREADRMQKVGIEVSHRLIFVGGQRITDVQSERTKLARQSRKESK